MGRVVVTGGAGFIGSHLVRALLAAGDEVVVVDRLDHGPPDPALVEHPRLELHRTDVRDRPSLARVLSAGVDRVFHLAALHYVPWCERHPEETTDVNVGGTAALLDALRDVPHRAVVLASSAAVYGFQDEPLGEDSGPAPAGAYGRSKLQAEERLREHRRRRPDVAAVAARFFNVYGPGETNPHVIPEILACLHRGQPLRLGNLWPKRDYVHVSDVVRAVLALSTLQPSSSHPDAAVVANVATGTGATVEDLVAAASAAAGRSLDVVVEESRRRASDGHLVGRNDHLRSLTGWEPEVALPSGIAHLVSSSDAVSPGGRRG